MPTPPRRTSRPATPARAPSQHELHPSRFAVDESWLVIKASRTPMRVEEDGPVDIYVLQDAASMFIFGTVLVSVGSRAAPEEEIVALLQGARRKRGTWPKRVVLSDADAVVRPFAVAAVRSGMSVEYVPEAALAFYTDDVQSGFSEHFGL